MDKKIAISISAIIIVVLLVSVFFTPMGGILESLLFANPSYELKPEELCEEWFSVEGGSWYGCRTAECMGDNSDITIARAHGGYNFPINWGFLKYTVPQSSGLYQGTPLSVTVYVRAKEAVGRETSTITPTLDFPDQSLEGQTFRVPYQGYTTFSHKFNCGEETWEDVDNITIGAIARPNSQNGEWVYVSEIWAIVEYDDTPPPPPLPDITVLTSPDNCDVLLVGIETLNSGNDGMVVFENVHHRTYDIMVTKAGYQPLIKTVFVDSDVTISMSLTLIDEIVSFDLTVLTSPDNCNVTLAGMETLNSGNDGMVVFEDISLGTYTIMVSKAGYSSFTETVSIDSDATISVGITADVIADVTSQEYLMPMLFLILIVAGIIAGIAVYHYKKK